MDAIPPNYKQQKQRRLSALVGYAVLSLVLAALVREAFLTSSGEPESYFSARSAESGSAPLRSRVRIGKWDLEDTKELSVANMKRFMDRFVQEPHPMGSPANRVLAADMLFLLRSFGWQARAQDFTAVGPNLQSPRFGGRSVVASPTTEVSGQNIIGYLPGRESCVVIIGGHYDTKRFDEFRFVGANDGGSSTVLMLELARLIPKVWGKAKGATAVRSGMWRSCGLALVFFDGEEAILPGWSDGAAVAGVDDNLYGSRAFVRSLTDKGDTFLKQKIALVLVLDMVGHKNQKLFITEGSDKAVAESLERLAGEVKIARAPFRVEDDHIPFVQRGFRVAHVIDWTNLDEWHKPTDTPDIIGFDGLGKLGDLVLRFLGTPRMDQLARRDK